MTDLRQASPRALLNGPQAWRPWQLIVASLSYGLLVRLSIALFDVPGQFVSAIWIPSGALVALLMLTVRAQWPLLLGLLLPAHLLGNMLAGRAVMLSAAYGIANFTEALLVATLLLRVSGPAPTFGRVREVLGLNLLATTVGAQLSAGLAVLSLQGNGTRVPWLSWLLWSLSVLLGTILVAPPIVAMLREPPWQRRGQPRLLETIGLVAALVAGTAILFSRNSTVASVPLLILPYPLLIWAALRLRPAMAQLLVLLLAGLATWYTVHGTGPLMLLSGDTAQRIVWLQGYLLVCVVSTQLVAASAQDRRVALDDLAARERRQSFVTTYARDIIGLVEPDATFSFVSPSCANVIGRTPTELLGRAAYDFIHPDDAEQVRASIVALRTGRVTGPVLLRYRAEHADGRWVTLEATVALADEPGAPPGRLVTVTRDVTERQRIESRLAQAQRLESLGQLAGGLAHDFNNVLQTVLASAEELRLDLSPAPASPTAENVDNLRTAALRGIGITRQLLTLGRDTQTDPRPVQVDEAIERFVSTARTVAGRDIAVQTELAATNSRILLPPAELEQVLLNLVLNARDAMQQRGRIVLRSRRVDPAQRDPAWPLSVGDGPWVELAVDDDGPGVPAELRDRIFEPFFSTKAADTGSGLGLASAYAAMARARGHLWCEPASIGGASFRIVVPMLG